MYAPKHFAVFDPATLRDAARRLSAGQLITVGPEGPEASFIPLLVSDDVRTVTGHLARANGQWRRADPSVPALVTWVGPDAYVSPGYYPSKTEHGKVVPTWNFISIQARGSLRFHDDDGWKRAHVASLTTAHERAMPQPWSVDDAPSGYIDGLVRSIVGVELEVTSIQGKWKLSQNRPEPDILGVIRGLEAEGSCGATALAREMAVAREMALARETALARHHRGGSEPAEASGG